MTLLRPMWYYGIRLWGSAKPSNTRIIQSFQSISLRLISDAPWYITNEWLHKDICIPTFKNLSKFTYKKHTKHSVLTQILYSLKYHSNKFQVIHPDAWKGTGVGTYFPLHHFPRGATIGWLQPPANLLIV